MSELYQSLMTIQQRSEYYNLIYTGKILKHSENYIEKYKEIIKTDCWTTMRMLLNVLNQGNKPIFAEIYHI